MLTTVFTPRCTQAILNKKHHLVTATKARHGVGISEWIIYDRGKTGLREKKEKALPHSNSSLKKKNRNSENQHNPGIIQKGGGEEGQSEERHCNTLLLWMRVYSCLLQCCRKSGRDKEDHLHSEGNLLSVWFLLYTLGLHLIGSTSWDLNANRDQTIVPTEHTPGNPAGGGRV